MELTRSQRVMIAIAALAAATGLAAYDAQNESTEPVAIIDARLGPGDRVEVLIDRCDSEAEVTSTGLAEDRLVVEISARAGSGDCQDVVDVTSITDDIVELEDVTSGEVFVLRSPAGGSNRPPVGTRE